MAFVLFPVLLFECEVSDLMNYLQSACFILHGGEQKLQLLAEKGKVRKQLYKLQDTERQASLLEGCLSLVLVQQSPTDLLSGSTLQEPWL